MFTKFLSLALAASLISIIISVPASAQSQTQTDARQTEKVKARILKLETGKKVLVEVRLKDNRILKGYVSETTDDHFDVTDAKTGVVTSVVYAQVQQLKVNKYPHQVGIGLAFVGGIIGIALILAVALRGQ
jgi:RNase H-fold protein (predicted Holliday junction resolvase)